MDKHDLEPITDENWHEAASALCRAADIFETLATNAFDALLKAGHRETVEELVADHTELIEQCSAVVKHWQDYLEIRDAD